MGRYSTVGVIFGQRQGDGGIIDSLDTQENMGVRPWSANKIIPLGKPAILLIGPTPPPYHGVSVATQVLLDSLSRERFDVVHVDTADRRSINHVDHPDILDVLLFIRQWLAHATAIIRNRPQICYLPLCQSRIGFVRDSFFMMPAFVAQCAVVAHLHGANFDVVYMHGGHIFRWYVDFILKRVTKFVVLGEMLKSIFKPWANREAIAVVPNGVPDSPPSNTSRERADTASSCRVVFLSTLNRQKGLFVLLDAIPLVAREYPDVEFHIAGPWCGTGTEDEAREQLVSTQQTARVIFHGLLIGEDKIQFLRSGDVFVFPGIQQEGQPLTVLEAMCAGLPVIATDRGCLRETVVQGVTGFIVPPNSPEVIAERLLYLIRSPEERRRLGQNARLRYEEHYTMGIFAARMADLFAQITQSNFHGNPKR